MDATANTTRIKRVRSGWLALLLAVPLVLASATYTAAQLILLTPQARPAIREVGRLPAALQLHEASLRLFSDSRTQADLALLALANARANQLDWPTATRALEASLRARPAEALNWARLAAMLHDGYIPAARFPLPPGDYLGQSLLTGYLLPTLMPWRLSLALQLWPDLSAAQQQLVVQQVWLLWNKQHQSLLRLGRRADVGPQLEAVMREFLPTKLAHFLKTRGPLRAEMNLREDTAP